MSFSLPLESLRALGSWAADRAERVLSIYENHIDSNSRPRATIEGIRIFAGGGRRTAQLRSLALSAFSAAREAGDPYVGEEEVHRAIEQFPAVVCEILLQMPTRQTGKTRLEQLLYQLDAGIRSRGLPENG